jgi:dihydroorotase-like cyclic amidohydrolase
LNSPFYGWILKGKPMMTIVGGKLVLNEQPERSQRLSLTTA